MKKIFVSLDELLDTRLGFVSQYNPDVVKTWLSPDNNDYFLRMSDELLYQATNMTEAQYNVAWRKRTKQTLMDSVVTHIPNIIVQLINEYQNSGEESLKDSYCELYVNIHPYALTQEEKDEFMSLFSNDIFPTVKAIHFISYRLEDMKYNVMKGNYDYIFLYDFNRWLDIHGRDFIRDKAVFGDMVFFVPRLFLKVPDIDNEKSPAKKQELIDIFKLDPFKIIEAAYAHKLRMQFIPASDFGPVFKAPYRRKSFEADIIDQYRQSDLETDCNPQFDPLYQFLQEQGLLPEDFLAKESQKPN